MTWRAGRKLGRTLYRDEVCVGMVDTPELAAAIVQAMNVNIGLLRVSVGNLAEYIEDGVYASFDGYYVWLKTGSHLDHEATNKVALEPSVFAALVRYREGLPK